MSDNEQESTEKQEEVNEQKPTEEKRKVSTPLLDAIDEKYSKLKELHEKTENVLGRMEAVYERMILSGNANASISDPPKKELTDEEYAKKFMNGEIGFSK